MRREEYVGRRGNPYRTPPFYDCPSRGKVVGREIEDWVVKENCAWRIAFSILKLSFQTSHVRSPPAAEETGGEQQPASALVGSGTAVKVSHLFSVSMANVLGFQKLLSPVKEKSASTKSVRLPDQSTSVSGSPGGVEPMKSNLGAGASLRNRR